MSLNYDLSASTAFTEEKVSTNVITADKYKLRHINAFQSTNLLW